MSRLFSDLEKLTNFFSEISSSDLAIAELAPIKTVFDIDTICGQKIYNKGYG